MAGYKSLIYEKKPPIAYITLNRPEKNNALSIGTAGGEVGLIEEICDACEDAKVSDDIRVIIMKGAGPCFSAGYDLTYSTEAYRKIWGPEGWGDAAYFNDGQVDLHNKYRRALWDNPKASIAQVHSYCLAGACHMLCFADFIICSEDALFGHPAVRFGAVDAQQLWPTYFGLRKAKEALMTGNFMSAMEAWRVGFVNKVVPKEKLEEEVHRLASAIAAMPPRTASYNKLAVNRWFEAQGLWQGIYTGSFLDGEEYSADLPGHLKEFNSNVAQVGIKEALRIRDEKFRERDKIIREENIREGKQMRAWYEERFKYEL